MSPIIIEQCPGKHLVVPPMFLLTPIVNVSIVDTDTNREGSHERRS